MLYKTLVIAALLGSLSAKTRDVPDETYLTEYSNENVEKTHERKVRESAVHRCHKGLFV